VPGQVALDRELKQYFAECQIGALQRGDLTPPAHTRTQAAARSRAARARAAEGGERKEEEERKKEEEGGREGGRRKEEEGGGGGGGGGGHTPAAVATSPAAVPLHEAAAGLGEAEAFRAWRLHHHHAPEYPQQAQVTRPSDHHEGTDMHTSCILFLACS